MFQIKVNRQREGQTDRQTNGGHYAITEAQWPSGSVAENVPCLVFQIFYTLKQFKGTQPLIGYTV